LLDVFSVPLLEWQTLAIKPVWSRSAMNTPTRRLAGDHPLDTLAATIRARRTASGDTSYTRQLLNAGAEKCARKFGEESIELVIAALGTDTEAITAEAADVLYHLLVILEVRDVSFTDVVAVLERRMDQSGLAEKAARNIKPQRTKGI
jgi:phosphoribosyl-ATP pyrophosphohydrolase